ncbi:MAG: hypothetical protein AAF664_15295, partial [Planctomycetota bacterium]
PVGYSIRVIPLKHIGSQEMATILQPFAGTGIVGIDAQRTIIVLDESMPLPPWTTAIELGA